MRYVNLQNVRASYDTAEDVVRVTSSDPDLAAVGGSMNIVVRRGTTQDGALRRLLDVGDDLAKEVVPLPPPSEFGPRQIGDADLEWQVGIEPTTARSALVDDFLAGDGHLLIAGKSPSGKSVLLGSMILQLAAQNGPGELRFWMIEPKNELQEFRDLDLTEKFVDSWSGADFAVDAAELLEEAASEARRRTELFAATGSTDLAAARDRAVEEALRAEVPLAENPLYLPYVVVIVEECAAVFAEAPPKDEYENDARKRAVIAAAEVAEIGRAAGIHLVCVTGYPTNATIPSVIRNRMRRIGLRAQNSMASDVILPEADLDQIRIVGERRLGVEGAHRSFRGYWVRDGDPAEGEENDMVEWLRWLIDRYGAEATGRK